MVSMVGSVTLLIAMGSTGGIFFNRNPNNLVLPPQPGYGVGFANGNPDLYGYINPGVLLPLAADRTPDYYFPRYLAYPATQVWLPNYYNPYVSRGQRFLPAAGCGGLHPASGPPRGQAAAFRRSVLGPIGGPSAVTGSVRASARMSVSIWSPSQRALTRRHTPVRR